MAAMVRQSMTMHTGSTSPFQDLDGVSAPGMDTVPALSGDLAASGIFTGPNETPRNEDVIAYSLAHTELGRILMAATHRGVCFLHFGESDHSLRAELRREFPRATLVEETERSSPTLDAWIEAFTDPARESGAVCAFPVDLRGTPFQTRVWRYLRTIPRGEIRSYAQVADALGRPSAYRAVAAACARNRIAVAIPCHRVRRADGALSGYRWGTHRKQRLLEMEGIRVDGSGSRA